MSEATKPGGAALWRVWRDGSPEPARPQAPDALSIAAYAENRLTPPGRDPELDAATVAIEAWLASDPDALSDLAAARTAAGSVQSDRVDAAIVARAATLIAAPAPGIVPFRPKRQNWRGAVAWSGLAASLLAASLVGFSIGLDDSLSLLGAGASPSSEQASPSLEQEVIGPSGSVLPGVDSVLPGLDEDSGT
jgi:hypothetical protein